jgi:type IV pilus biogenesis protein PilP
LILIGAQTSNALRESGTWAPPPRPGRFAADPYASLDRAIGRAAAPMDPGPLRDPFSFGHAPQAVRIVVHHSVVPTLPPLPVVTAIVTGANQARAIVVYDGANYSVKEGDLFAHYKVISITAEQVVLEDGTGRLVLKRPSKGD